MIKRLKLTEDASHIGTVGKALLAKVDELVDGHNVLTGRLDAKRVLFDGSLKLVLKRIAKLEAAISPKTHEVEKSCETCFHPQNDRVKQYCENEDCNDDYSGWISSTSKEPK